MAPLAASAASAVASSASHMALRISSYTADAFRGSVACSLVAANCLREQSRWIALSYGLIKLMLREQSRWIALSYGLIKLMLREQSRWIALSHGLIKLMLQHFY